MSTIVQPDEIGTMFREIDRRLRALEGGDQQAYALRVQDAANPAINRVEIGHLLANGSSPAQDGMRINDATGAPISDSTGLIYSQRVVDGGGITRMEVGNLAQRDNSAAQFGLRVNDAAGHPILDSLGLIGVMSLLANLDTISPVSGTTADLNTWADVPAATITFTLTRPQTFLLLGTASCACLPSKFGKMRFVTDGASPSTYLLWSNGTASGFTGYAPGTLFQVLKLPIGPHTAKWQWATSPTGVGNLNVNTASLYAFLLGG